MTNAERENVEVYKLKADLELNRALKEVERLRAAAGQLLRAGSHSWDCVLALEADDRGVLLGTCDCGWSQAIAAYNNLVGK